MALDFLILYEHVVREYESILLLKAELARRGYTVELRQLLDRKKLKYFTLKKPKVLVSSCMYDDEAINSHVYNNIGVCNKGRRVVQLRRQRQKMRADLLGQTHAAAPCGPRHAGKKLPRDRRGDDGFPAARVPGIFQG